MNVIHEVEGPDGRIHQVEGPDTASPESIMAVVGQQLANEQSPREADDGFLDVLGYGVDSALNRAGATWDTITSDLEGVEQSAIEAQQIPQTESQKSFRKDLNDTPEGGFTDEVVNLFHAVVDNPGGAWDEMVAQLPNSVPAIGGLLAGGKAGAMAGAALGPAGSLTAGTIGAVVGAGIGLFLGTGVIETGAMAQGKAGDEDGFTPEDRMSSLKGGARKSATIAGFDLATLGLNRFLAGMPGKAAYGAVSKFLGDNGVDIASQAAVKHALRADKALLAGAMDVAQKSVRGAAQTPGILAGLAAESVGEGAGEYFGEMAAGNEPSYREALLEGALAMPQSLADTAIGRAFNKDKPNTIKDISGQGASQFETEQVTGVTPDHIDTGMALPTAIQAEAINQTLPPMARSTTAEAPLDEAAGRENPYAPEIVLTKKEKEAVAKLKAAEEAAAKKAKKVPSVHAEELPDLPNTDEAAIKAAMAGFQDTDADEARQRQHDKKYPTEPVVSTETETPVPQPIQPTGKEKEIASLKRDIEFLEMQEADFTVDFTERNKVELDTARERLAKLQPPPKLVTKEMLDDLDIAPQALLRKTLIDKDLNDPVEAKQVKDALIQYGTSTSLPAASKGALGKILKFYKEAEVSEQPKKEQDKKGTSQFDFDQEVTTDGQPKPVSDAGEGNTNDPAGRGDGSTDTGKDGQPADTNAKPATANVNQTNASGSMAGPVVRPEATETTAEGKSGTLKAETTTKPKTQITEDQQAKLDAVRADMDDVLATTEDAERTLAGANAGLKAAEDEITGTPETSETKAKPKTEADAESPRSLDRDEEDGEASPDDELTDTEAKTETADINAPLISAVNELTAAVRRATLPKSAETPATFPIGQTSADTTETETKTETPPVFGANNKGVKTKRADEIKAKYGPGKLSSIGPEMLADAIELALYYIEGGAHSFTAYSKMMIETFGEDIKEYLTPIYETVRESGDIDTENMSSVEEAEHSSTGELTEEQKDNLTAANQIKKQAMKDEVYGDKLDQEGQRILSPEELDAKEHIEAQPAIKAEVQAEYEAMTKEQRMKASVSGHGYDISKVHYTNENPIELVTVDDYKKVTAMLRENEDKRTKDVAGEYTYFNDGRRVIDNITDIAHDLVFRWKKHPVPHANRVMANLIEPEVIEEHNFHQQKGGEAARAAAKWIVANLSLKAKMVFREKLRTKTKEYLKIMGMDDNFIHQPVVNAKQMALQAKQQAEFTQYLLDNYANTYRDRKAILPVNRRQQSSHELFRQRDVVEAAMEVWEKGQPKPQEFFGRSLEEMQTISDNFNKRGQEAKANEQTGTVSTSFDTKDRTFTPQERIDYAADNKDALLKVDEKRTEAEKKKKNKAKNKARGRPEEAWQQQYEAYILRSNKKGSSATMLAPKDKSNAPQQDDMFASEDEPSEFIAEEENELSAFIVEEENELNEVTTVLIENGDILVESLSLPLSAITASDISIPPYAMRMLEDGNLVGALAVIADSSPNALVSRIASEIAKNIGSTKISVLKDVKNDSGKSIAGSFDPKTNTIKIRAGAIPIHVLIHEGGHAVLSHILSNKSHPLTKKLNKLYESVKDDLSSHYGSESLDEFVSEALGNQRFKQELASLYASRKSDKGALRQFYDAVIEFFTKLFNINSTGTYEQFNDMIIGMMSPAPETRGAGEYFMMSQQEEMDALVIEVGKGEDASLKKFKESQRTKDDALDMMQENVFHKLSYLAKRGAMGFLQTLSQADYTSKFGIDGTKELHHFYQQLEAAITNGQKPLNGFINKLNQWNKGGKLLRMMAPDSQRAKTEILNRVLPEMTIWETNGLLNEADAKVEYKDDQAKLDKWYELRPAMKALEEDGRKIIQNYWDAFSQMKKELIKSLEATINDAVDDPVIRKQLKEKVFKDLLNKANIEPYSPLWRSGKYWIEFNARDDNAEGTVYETYKTRAARNRRWRELKQLEEDTKDDVGGSEVWAVKPYEKPTFENFDKSPPTKFIKDAMDIFNKANVPAETKKMFMDLFIESLPETSFAKSFQRRKGSRGYEQDALGTFQHTAYGLNRQIQQLKHHKRIRKQLGVFHDNVKAFNEKHEGESEWRQKLNTSKALVDEWDARTKFALMPDANWQATASRNVNRFAFMWTIGFGPSSAIVNTGQLPMVVFPFQAIKTDPKTAYNALMTAGSFVLGAGLEHQVELLGTADHERFTHRAGAPSGDNYYIENYATGKIYLADESQIDDTKIYYDGLTKRGLANMLTPLMQYMSDEGVLDRTVAYDSIGAELSGKDKNVGEQLSIMGAWMFHTTERLNRQVAMIGSYLNEIKRLEKVKAGKINKDTGRMEFSDEVLEKAMHVALHDTQYTNGGSMLQTAPRWAQKNIGRIAMMYKSFGVNMYTLQGKLLHTALVDSKAPKADRILAGKQFMAINGMVALMSGIQGITLYGMYAFIANMFKDDDEEDFETVTRKAVGELAYKGGINWLTKLLGGEGVDVAARIGLSNLIISHDRYNFDPSFEKGFVKMFGGPAYGSIKSIVRGAEYIGEGEYTRGFEAVLPAGIRNMAKIVTPVGLGRYADEGILTRRGDPIMGDLGFGLLAAQFLGFAPAEYTRNQERSQSLKGIDRAVTEKRTKLLRKLYVTQRFGDGSSNVMEEINKFNAKWPQMAIEWKTVKASREKHMETSQNMYNGVLLSPYMRNYLFGLADGWGGGR